MISMYDLTDRQYDAVSIRDRWANGDGRQPDDNCRLHGNWRMFDLGTLLSGVRCILLSPLTSRMCLLKPTLDRSSPYPLGFSLGPR